MPKISTQLIKNLIKYFVVQMISLILTNQVTGPKLNENAQTYATRDANAKYRVDAGRSTDPHLRRNAITVGQLRQRFVHLNVMSKNVALNRTIWLENIT